MMMVAQPKPAMHNSEALLQVSAIAHSFSGLKVLSDVNLIAQHHQVVGLIGPNGSGKTTLFNIISGFLRPKVGEVRIDGKNINQHSVQMRSLLGLQRTFQIPKVFENMTVIENVMMGAHAETHAGLLSTMLALPHATKEMAAVKLSAGEICERFGIAHLADEKAGELPAGRRRIVELARAYKARPRLLLLDEPSSGLSAPEVDDLRHWIRVFADEGITIVLVSHDMGLMNVCDIVHVLYFGCIIATGPMAVIREDPAVRDAYLGI
jgi:ABC-type branched-subunit amino acid transport system ATPase component